MQGLLSQLDPHKAVLPVVALIGLIPILVQYRDQSRWFVVGYAMLVVATLATNLENLFLGGLLNHVEHLVGLLGSGVAFLLAGYFRREQIRAESESTDSDPVEATTEVNA